MSNKQKITYNIVTLVFLNITYWICAFYPNRIVEWYDTRLSFAGTIWNLLYFVVFGMFLIIYVAQNESLFSSVDVLPILPVQKRAVLYRMSALIISQVAIDIISEISLLLVGSFMYLTLDILTILTWLLFYIILTIKNDKLRKLEVSASVKFMFFTVIALIVGVCILDINTANESGMLKEKYVEESEYLIQSLSNILNKQSVINLILNSALGSVVIVLLSKKQSKCDAQCEKQTKKGKEKRENSYFKWRRVGKVCLRVVSLGIIMWVLVVTKFLMYPTMCLSNIGCFIGGGIITTEYNDNFFYDYKDYEYSRYKNNVYVKHYFDDFKDYEKNKIQVLFESKKLSKVIEVKEIDISDYGVRDTYEYDGNELKTIYGYCKDCFVNGHKVNIYGNYAVCYVKDGDPYVIEFKDIKNQPRNELLVELLKQEICEGNNIVFEYGCEYLLKFDKEFIFPYICRYSEGNFNEQELQYIEVTKYNPEYIINFSKEKVEKYIGAQKI